jgi:phosphomannomutase
VIDETLRARIEAWRAIDPDPVTRAELDRLVEESGRSAAAEAELRDRFAGRLAFGTAGLRAARGAGPRRMNRLVVQQLGAGLMRWLAETDRPVSGGSSGPTVVIGWDARHRADEFGREIARVVAAAGGQARLLPGPVPTPVLAFAVRHLAADAGVMCTASHNPPGDSGCKIYRSDGAQIAPPHDSALAGAIDEVARAGRAVPLAPPTAAAIHQVGDDVLAAYEDHVLGLGLGGPGGDLPVVHTALHGVGGALAGRLLARAGFTAVDVVPEQAAPDPDFPTTPHPDPEEPEAFTRALAHATARGAALVLANDPDADRLGAAVPTPDGWRLLTGNELGALLCEHVLQLTSHRPEDRLVVTSLVSSRLLGAIARHHGVHHVEVPAGFKWIVRPAIERPELRFVFGFEEAFGFAFDAEVRDKDGLAAAVAVAGMAAALRAEGRGVLDALEGLSRRHGHHATCTWAVRMSGPGATERLQEVVDRWRARPPSALAGRLVTSVDDLATGRAELPAMNAVAVTAEGGARVVLRPSGTEPKIKVHLEVVDEVPPGPDGYAAACAAGDAAVEKLRLAVAADLGLDP